jgi:hypothetical protein
VTGLAILHVSPQPIAAIVDFSTLGKTVLYSFIAGIGFAAVFGGGVSSAAGLVEAVRTGRTAAVVGWGALAVLCTAAALAAVAVGIYVMTAG